MLGAQSTQCARPRRAAYRTQSSRRIPVFSYSLNALELRSKLPAAELSTYDWVRGKGGCAGWRPLIRWGCTGLTTETKKWAPSFCTTVKLLAILSSSASGILLCREPTVDSLGPQTSQKLDVQLILLLLYHTTHQIKKTETCSSLRQKKNIQNPICRKRY